MGEKGRSHHRGMLSRSTHPWRSSLSEGGGGAAGGMGTTHAHSAASTSGQPQPQPWLLTRTAPSTRCPRSNSRIGHTCAALRQVSGVIITIEARMCAFGCVHLCAFGCMHLCRVIWACLECSAGGWASSCAGNRHEHYGAAMLAPAYSDLCSVIILR